MNETAKRSVPLGVLWLATIGAAFAVGWWFDARGRGAKPPAAGAEEHTGEESAEAASPGVATSLALSPEALANLGLTEEMIQPIEETTFVRTVTVPAIVVERPGRTELPVSTPMTGIITHVHAVTGEAVTPGTLLFQIRLTHEDLVNAQKDFLQSVGDLAVEEKEITRLEGAAASGALPGRVMLERQYARDKLLSSLESQREALRLHGLSSEQIDRIERERRLLTELRVYVPSPDDHSHDKEKDQDELQLSERAVLPAAYDVGSHADEVQTAEAAGTAKDESNNSHSAAHDDTLIVQRLRVHKGQTVETGEVLCVLADYKELYIEGQAFETDAGAIAEAKRRGWKATAVVEEDGKETEIKDLDFAYVANEIDPAARTLAFYASLENDIIEDSHNDGGQRFVAWKYRPGQRMQLRVPVEEWTGQLVLPIDAVEREGPDSYVFQQNGKQFDRVAVHEVFRDRTSVVIANDGSIFPGDVVALRGAHQMQLALKNKAGGGVDPHAGHHH